MLTKPAIGSSESPHWKRTDAMVKGWPHTAMEKCIHTSVRDARTARDMWQELEDRYGKVSAP